LFATPGYAALEAREKRRAALQHGIRLALNPSLAGEREKVLAAESWTARVVRHVEKLPANRGVLDRARFDLVNDAFLPRAIGLAQTLLPDGTTRRLGCATSVHITRRPGHSPMLSSALSPPETRPR
jgi:hypothetical protein